MNPISPNPTNQIDLFLFFFGVAAILITQIAGIIAPKWRHYHVFVGGAFILFGLAFEVGFKGPAILFGATHVAIYLRMLYVEKQQPA